MKLEELYDKKRPKVIFSVIILFGYFQQRVFKNIPTGTIPVVD